MGKMVEGAESLTKKLYFAYGKECKHYYDAYKCVRSMVMLSGPPRKADVTSLYLTMKSSMHCDITGTAGVKEGSYGRSTRARPLPPREMVATTPLLLMIIMTNNRPRSARVFTRLMLVVVGRPPSRRIDRSIGASASVPSLYVLQRRGNNPPATGDNPTSAWQTLEQARPASAFSAATLHAKRALSAQGARPPRPSRRTAACCGAGS